MLHRLTELYTIIDDFCKEYEKDIKRKALVSGTRNTRKRDTKVKLSEILTILVIYQSSNIKNFKSFYIFLQREMKGAFRDLCSYQRFIELTPRALMPLLILLNCLYGSCDGTSYADSTKIEVCHIKREKRNKLFKGLAKKSKGTMGWFYGFKLHIITNKRGELLNAFFSYANVDDRQGLINMCKSLFGDIIADRGYLGKELKEKLKAKGINLITRGRKNMKADLSLKEQALLNSRNIIETVIGKLKIQFNLEHTRHRSICGFMLNILSSLIAYCFSENKPKTEIKYAKNINKPILAIA
jgi:hypothetical protein